MTDPGEPPYGHEPSSIANRQVIRVAVILILSIVAAAFIIHAVLHRVAPQHAQAVARTGTIPPEPRLEVHPSADLAALRAQKIALLSSWSWTTSTHTFARIPIERAMEIYAQQHAEESKPPPTPPGPAP